MRMDTVSVSGIIEKPQIADAYRIRTIAAPTVLLVVAGLLAVVGCRGERAQEKSRGASSGYPSQGEQTSVSDVYAEATARHQSGDLEGALEQYTQAIAADRQRVDPYVGRANVYKSMGKFDQAQADYDTAVAFLEQGCKRLGTAGGTKPICEGAPADPNATY